MMHYYQVYLPDGKTWKLEVGPLCERMKVVSVLLERWEPYCLNGWDKEGADMYSPASKIKRFLNSLAYYLLFDDTKGLITEYKEKVNRNREIPISSCPDIENVVYSSVSVPKQNDDSVMLDKAEDIVAKYRKKPPRKETRWDRIRAFRKEYPKASEPKSYRVDTENKFVRDDGLYMIDTKLASQYSADERGIYGMDTIWSSDTPYGPVFYDQDFRKIIYGAVKKID